MVNLDQDQAATYHGSTSGEQTRQGVAPLVFGDLNTLKNEKYETD